MLRKTAPRANVARRNSRRRFTSPRSIDARASTIVRLETMRKNVFSPVRGTFRISPGPAQSEVFTRRAHDPPMIAVKNMISVARNIQVASFLALTRTTPGSASRKPKNARDGLRRSSRSQPSTPTTKTRIPRPRTVRPETSPAYAIAAPKPATRGQIVKWCPSSACPVSPPCAMDGPARRVPKERFPITSSVPLTAPDGRRTPSPHRPFERRERLHEVPLLEDEDRVRVAAHDLEHVEAARREGRGEECHDPGDLLDADDPLGRRDEPDEAVRGEELVHDLLEPHEVVVGVADRHGPDPRAGLEAGLAEDPSH